MFVHQGHQARLLVEYISLARQSCNVSHDFSPLFFSPGAGGMSCVDVRKRSEMGLALDLWSCLDMVRLEKGGKGERASCFWKCPVGQVLELATWQAPRLRRPVLPCREVSSGTVLPVISPWQAPRARWE